MHGFLGICHDAIGQVPLPREEEYLREMPSPLLPPRHEGTSKKNYEVLWTKNASVSSRLGVASRLGRAKETTDAGQKAFRLRQTCLGFSL